jgi:AAA family ATP:ADP antiporter
VEKPVGLRAVFSIRQEELPFALLMFGYFFLVITSFWILKPVKKALLIGFYDDAGLVLLGAKLSAAQAELIAKVVNMAVAFLAAVVFSTLSEHLRRQRLTLVFSGFFLLSYFGYSTLLDRAGTGTVWSFYLFGDLFSTLMVATFFAFLNDSVTPDRAKRIYGLVGLGGVTGGVFGTTVVDALISTLPRAKWMFVCAGLVVAIAVLALAAGRIVDRNPPPERPHTDAEPQEGASSAIEGARLVFRSPYLLAIVAIVGLYEIVSTVLDFQFSATVSHYLDGAAIGAQFSRVFWITNIVAMLVQLLLTSFVMTRLGVGVALLVLPVAILVGSSGFLVLPTLWLGSLLNTADNGFSYSINQSAKEALYVPTSRDEKYKAKAFIDVFVQRFAKSVAVGVTLGITLVFDDFSSVRWLGLVTLPVIVVWFVAARYAGRRFAELTHEGR